MVCIVSGEKMLCAQYLRTSNQSSRVEGSLEITGDLAVITAKLPGAKLRDW